MTDQLFTVFFLLLDAPHADPAFRLTHHPERETLLTLLCFFDLMMVVMEKYS